MRRTLCIIAVGLLLAGVPAGAHHSPVEVQFDVDNPIALHGVLIRVEWVNPHARIYLAVRSAGGVDEIWLVETGPPSRLARAGLGLSSFRPGDEIVIDAFPSRDGSRTVGGKSVTLPGQEGAYPLAR